MDRLGWTVVRRVLVLAAVVLLGVGAVQAARHLYVRWQNTKTAPEVDVCPDPELDITCYQEPGPSGLVWLAASCVCLGLFLALRRR